MSMTIDAPKASPSHVGPYRVDPTKGGHDGSVSMQWMSRPHDQRFLSLTELADYKRKFYEGSWEGRSDSKQVEIIAPEIKTREDMHKLRVGLTTGEGDTQRVHEVAPSNWAFGQLAALGKSPAAFLRELPSPIVSDVLTWRLRHAREVEQIKFYGDTELLHAATGPDYGRIPDFEVVEAVQQVAGDGTGSHRWKIPGVLDWSTNLYDPKAPVTKDSTTLYASDRDLFMFLVDDLNPIEVGKLQNGDPDLMFRGFYLQNSEVGSKALKLAAFYLRAVCMNRNLWGVEHFEDITIRHSRLAPDRWLQQAQPALRSYSEGSAKTLVEGVAMAKGAKVATDDEEALAFLNSRNFSRSAAKAILETVEKEEGHKARSIWDMAQGITAYARNVPNTDDRIGVEMEAKRLLDRVVH